MDIKILGTGCVNCKNLENLTRAALDELGVDVEIEKVTDPGEIVSWGVMSTPALVIDDEVVLSGRVPPVDQIRQLLAAALDEFPRRRAVSVATERCAQPRRSTARASGG